MAAARQVTNAELKQLMDSMRKEIIELPRVNPDQIDKRLGGIEGQLKFLNGTVRDNRENINALKVADAQHERRVAELDEYTKSQQAQIHALDITAAKLTVLVTGSAGAGGLIGVVLAQLVPLVKAMFGQP